MKDDLKNFLKAKGIVVDIPEIRESPATIRYIVELPPQTKLRDILKSKNDLDLLFGVPIKIEHPVGPMQIAIDTINTDRKFYSFSPTKTGNPLFVKIGYGSNEEILLDFEKTPHLLVGGESGSGKSTFLHSLILSLSSYTPDDTLLFLLDPKQLEFNSYKGWPNVYNFATGEFTPALGDAALRMAMVGLEAITKHMERRKKLLSASGMRSFQEYRNKVKKEPYIFIFADEAAELLKATDPDLIPTAKKNMELLIPILRMGRALGIHVILSSQRPSVDIVPSQIKANMGRICFKVASRIDSFVILDSEGGEALLGKGDFILKTDKLLRGQAFSITNEDIAKTQKVSYYPEKPFWGFIDVKKKIENRYEVSEIDETILKQLLEFPKDEISSSEYADLIASHCDTKLEWEQINRNLFWLFVVPAELPPYDIWNRMDYGAWNQYQSLKIHRKAIREYFEIYGQR